MEETRETRSSERSIGRERKWASRVPDVDNCSQMRGRVRKNTFQSSPPLVVVNE